MLLRENDQPALTKGADGWRAIISEGFCEDSVTNLTRAIGQEIASRYPDQPVLVSCDGRFHSKFASEAAVETISSCGLRAILVQALPTPIATFAQRRLGCSAAIIVTASHNPFYWNGVKLKVAPGRPPGHDLELAIERRRAAAAVPEASSGGKIEVMPNDSLIEMFADELLAHVDITRLRQDSPRVVVDGLGGVAGTVLAYVLERAGCSVRTVGSNGDPLFDGLVPDPMRRASRRRCQAKVRDEGADVGFVLDGDGDRIGVVGPSGNFHEPHDVLALVLERIGGDGRHGDIAVTVATGAIVRRIAATQGRQTIETAIGFKNIAPYMERGAIMLGGGAVGDIGIARYGCDRDPAPAAMELVDHLCHLGMSLDAAVKRLHHRCGQGVYHSATYYVRAASGTQLQTAIEDAAEAVGLSRPEQSLRIDGIKCRFSEGTWVLLRNASTEPGLRLFAEFPEEKVLTDFLAALEPALSRLDPS